MAARSKLTMKIQVLAHLSITTRNQAHVRILQFLPLAGCIDYTSSGVMNPSVVRGSGAKFTLWQSTTLGFITLEEV